MKQIYQIAQFNIAEGIEEITHPVMQPFVEQLDAVNKIADISKGFIWRFQTESGNATDYRLYEDPKVIVNMSIWETLDDLFEYTYKSQHAVVMANRKQWFKPPVKPSFVIWWIIAGQIPSLEEGRRRLEYLWQNGPTSLAFTFKNTFDPPSLLELP